MLEKNNLITTKGWERLAYIFAIVVIVVGWAVSWGNSMAHDTHQDKDILSNKHEIQNIQRKCDAFGNISVANGAKLQLLLDYFDITDSTNQRNP